LSIEERFSLNREKQNIYNTRILTIPIPIAIIVDCCH